MSRGLCSGRFLRSRRIAPLSVDGGNETFSSRNPRLRVRTFWPSCADETGQQTPTKKASLEMAEVTSGDVTVIVLDEHERVYLKYLLERVTLTGSDADERALDYTRELLDALDVEVTV